MAGGVIYSKTSDDTTNLDGEDNVLIINTGYAYQIPFEGLTDYNEIKVTWLQSITTRDDNNAKPISTWDENSGNSTNEDFNYIGFTYNDTVTGLPLTNGVGFIGVRFNRYRALSNNTNVNSRPVNRGLVADDTITYNSTDYEDSHGKNGKFGYYCTSDTTELCASYYPNAASITDSPPNWRLGNGQPSVSTDNTNYWIYYGMGIELIDKGLSTQKLRLKLYQIFNYADVPNDDFYQTWNNNIQGTLNFVPDKVDLPNLRAVTKGTDFLAEYQDIPWNKDGVALPLPNNFFYYNAFFDLRPRISAITGRVIS